jgi:hypothetical protein
MALTVLMLVQVPKEQNAKLDIIVKMAHQLQRHVHKATIVK